VTTGDLCLLSIIIQMRHNVRDTMDLLLHVILQELDEMALDFQLLRFLHLCDNTCQIKSGKNYDGSE
jgi:hypothetical protein